MQDDEKFRIVCTHNKSKRLNLDLIYRAIFRMSSGGLYNYNMCRYGEKQYLVTFGRTFSNLPRKMCTIDDSISTSKSNVHFRQKNLRAWHEEVCAMGKWM